MGNAELQELVKAYAEGKVTFSDYRELRSELVDAFTGNIRIPEEKPSKKSAVENTEEQKVAVTHHAEKEDIISLTNNRNPVVFLLIVTIVLLSFVYLLTIL